eukprot:scaffold97124_cov17-Tisochrysis_lutea.AAC.1
MEPAHCGIEDSPIPYTGTPWDLHGLRLLVHSEWHVWVCACWLSTPCQPVDTGNRSKGGL